MSKIGALNMKCTACNTGELNPAYLDALLPCHTCSNCGGSLLVMTDYLRWQNENEAIDITVNPPVKPAAEETSKALMCPKTGAIMTKYRIGVDTDHRLDFSAAINAVWIDNGEWALLKANGLAGRLNRIFTDHWQKEIRAQESAEIMAELYQRRFAEHYPAIKEFRALLDSMKDRNEVLAYLMVDDPYRP